MTITNKMYELLAQKWSLELTEAYQRGELFETMPDFHNAIKSDARLIRQNDQAGSPKGNHRVHQLNDRWKGKFRKRI